MKKLAINLPENVATYFEEEARRIGISPSEFCQNWVTDHWINDHIGRPKPTRKDAATFQNLPKTNGHLRSCGAFDVAIEFPRYPRKSQEYAQQVVNEALKLPGVTARKSNRGIGITFTPNFISIEYLRKRTPGIELSLGAPRARLNALPGIKKGRTNSYSRIQIDDDQLLAQSLPLIREVYEVRQGPRAPKAPVEPVDEEVGI
jgi:hypothetical protein